MHSCMYAACVINTNSYTCTLSTFHKVKSWIKMWDVDGEKARHVYRLLFDALTEDRQRYNVH